MIVISCVDEHGGLMFNHRRQSSDIEVTKRIQQTCEGKRLWMSEYSSTLFKAMDISEVHVDDDFLRKAQAGDFAFVEDREIGEFEPSVEEVILFHWNRDYPSDVRLNLALRDQWICKETEEFRGHSHERVTRKHYVRKTD